MRKKRIAAMMAMAALSAMLIACGKSKDETKNGGDKEGTATEADALPKADVKLITLSSDKLLTLGDYQNFEYEAFAPITEEDAKQYYYELVDSLIEQGAKGQTEDESRNGTEVKEGDVINIDFVGYMDGEAFEGGTGTTNLTIGSGQFIDGFEDALIGKIIGEKVTIDVSFPDPYPNNTDLSGKPAQFDVTLNYALSEVEITRENAYSAYYGFESEEALIADIMEFLEEQNTEDNYLNQQQNNYILQIVETSEFADITDEVNTLYDQIRRSYEEVATQNGLDFETFIAYNGFTDVSAFEEELKKSAETQLKVDLVVRVLGEQEGLTLSDDEYNARAGALASGAGFEDLDAYQEQWDAYYGSGSFKNNVYLSYYESELFSRNSLEIANTGDTQESTDDPADDTEDTEDDTTPEQ